MKKIKVLFVCLGNICRSPMGEGIFRHLVESENLQKYFEIDSAGTSSYHVGEAPDPHGVRVCSKQGIDISMQQSRQFVSQDANKFDYILAMDKSNLDNIKQIAKKKFKAKVILFRDFDPEDEGSDVPDPWGGGSVGFTNVFEIIIRTNQELLKALRKEYDL